ncbi:MAG: MoaD/ThiS family protein [Anaerolineales bacterium]|nr:MoaD/ThiS family protein [Anaerolineales bacterium]
MKVQVQLFANLRECLPEGAERGRASVDLPEGTSLLDLFDALGVERCMSSGSFVEQASAWQISVNDVFTQDLHLALRDGDRVIVFPHMAGG